MPFREKGYAAVMGQEYDFSPYYHGPGDTLWHLDVGYLRDMIRGFTATVAHLAVRTPTPTVSVDSVVVAEGDAGQRDAVFTVSVAPPASEEVSVDFSTQDETAIEPADYLGVYGTLTFAPGEASKAVHVPVLGDVDAEDDETFHLVLQGPVGVALGDGWGTATILAESLPPPVAAIDSIAVHEGNVGSHDAVFTVSLTSPAEQPVTVDFYSEDVTATAGDDYVAVAGTLTFPPLATAQEIAVPIVGDRERETAESFRVRLENPTGATLLESWRTGTGTIRDDEYEASVEAVALAIVEGDEGLTDSTFRITVQPPDEASAPHPAPVVIDYVTQDGTAVAGFDYQLTQGSLTVGAPDWSATVTVPVVGEEIEERDEDFVLKLSSAQAWVVTPSASVTIVDDDHWVRVRRRWGPVPSVGGPDAPSATDRLEPRRPSDPLRRRPLRRSSARRR